MPENTLLYALQYATHERVEERYFLSYADGGSQGFLEMIGEALVNAGSYAEVTVYKVEFNDAGVVDSIEYGGFVGGEQITLVPTTAPITLYHQRAGDQALFTCNIRIGNVLELKDYEDFEGSGEMSALGEFFSTYLPA